MGTRIERYMSPGVPSTGKMSLARADRAGIRLAVREESVSPCHCLSASPSVRTPEWEITRGDTRGKNVDLVKMLDSIKLQKQPHTTSAGWACSDSALWLMI